MAGPYLITDRICPFCSYPLHSASALVVHERQRTATAQCLTCGTYLITWEANDLLAQWSLTDRDRVTMALALRRLTSRAEPPFLTTDALRSLREAMELPRPDALLDEAVLWFGQLSSEAGCLFSVTYRKCKAALGLVTPEAFDFLVDWMLTSDLFDGTKLQTTSGGEPHPISNCRLTPKGWSRYVELSRTHAASRYGFMAMRYGDAELDAVISDHFAPEVRKTGFDLRRLDQGQAAGLIDDQLRVMIRTSRFLVCDLTHGNRGADWESGFAEGLGKPVIYTCRSDVFGDRQHEHHPHFDTNHMVTVIWDPKDPSAAAKRLKDTVRATLPSETKLED